MSTLRRVLLALGLLLFIGLAWRLGPALILRTVGRLGWGFLAILAAAFLATLVNAAALRAAMPARDRIPLRLLAGCVLAGDAVNALTPSAVVGGEIVRFELLSRRLPRVSAASSVALGAGAQFAAQLLFIAAGIPLVADILMGNRLRQGLILFVAIVVSSMTGCAMVARRRDLFQRGARLLRRFGPLRAAIDAHAADAALLYLEVFGALTNRRGDLARSVALYFIGWSVGVGETALALHFVGSPASFRLCVSIETLSAFLDMVLFIVPARIGTQESGRYAVFRLLGLDGALGFSIGVIKRLRELAAAGVGLAVLFLWRRKTERPEEERPGDRLAI